MYIYPFYISSIHIHVPRRNLPSRWDHWYAGVDITSTPPVLEQLGAATCFESLGPWTFFYLIWGKLPTECELLRQDSIYLYWASLLRQGVIFTRIASTHTYAYMPAQKFPNLRDNCDVNVDITRSRQFCSNNAIRIISLFIILFIMSIYANS